MADELPPQPDGDTRDIGGETVTVTLPDGKQYTTTRFAAWVHEDDVLGLCGVCGQWKPSVGMLSPNSPMACRDCRTRYLSPAAQAPGNPLNV